MLMGNKKYDSKQQHMELPDFNEDRMFNTIGKVTENTPKDVLGDPQGNENGLFSMSLFQSFHDLSISSGGVSMITYIYIYIYYIS